MLLRASICRTFVRKFNCIIRLLLGGDFMVSFSTCQLELFFSICLFHDKARPDIVRSDVLTPSCRISTTSSNDLCFLTILWYCLCKNLLIAPLNLNSAVNALSSIFVIVLIIVFAFVPWLLVKCYRCRIKCSRCRCSRSCGCFLLELIILIMIYCYAQYWSGSDPLLR